MSDLLDDELRSWTIMDSLNFQQKILISDDGHIVVVARVLVPEHTGQPKLNAQNPEIKQGTKKNKKQLPSELEMSQHTLRLAETDYKETITCLVITAR